MNTYAERLRAARKQAGLRQTQLARATGITQQMISLLENGDGEKTTHTVALAAACGVSADWLETGKGPMMAPKWETVLDLSGLPAEVQDNLKQLVDAVRGQRVPPEDLADVIRILLRQQQNAPPADSIGNP